MNSKQEDLFVTHPAGGSRPVILKLSELGAVPSFKNRKRVMAWIDKALKVMNCFGGVWWIRKDSIKIRNILVTEPQHKVWMDAAITLFASKLTSIFQTEGVEMQTDALARYKIASLVPFDDCWTQCPEIVVRCHLVPKGQEGAKITITRIN